MERNITSQRWQASEILSFAVAGVGLVVLIGWIAGVDIVKTVLPGSVSMKFSTSVSFIFAGLAMLAISDGLKGNARPFLTRVVLPASILVIMLFMTSHITSILFSAQVGLDNLFVKEASDPSLTSSPGRPSIATIANFLLIMAAGIIMLANISREKKRRYLQGTGLAVGTVGAIAIIGYIASMPSLYYFSSQSTAMAIHTAILFVVAGAAFWLIPKAKVQVADERIARPLSIDTWTMLSFIVISIIPIIFIGGVILNNSRTFPSESLSGSIISLGISAALSISFFAAVNIRSMAR